MVHLSFPNRLKSSTALSRDASRSSSPMRSPTDPKPDKHLLLKATVVKVSCCEHH